MRKPLVWTLALALVGVALVTSACSPAPLPDDLQKSRIEEQPAEATPASTGEATAEGGSTAPEGGAAEESAEGTKAAASSEPAKETTGGGAGGDIFRIGMNGAGPIAFTGGDSQVVAPCVQCHGLNGAGGIAPDIRWKALEKRGYKGDMVALAITKGQNTKGKPLDKQMPRFTMSAKDLASLIAFLKALD